MKNGLIFFSTRYRKITVINIIAMLFAAALFFMGSGIHEAADLLQNESTTAYKNTAHTNEM